MFKCQQGCVLMCIMYLIVSLLQLIIHYSKFEKKEIEIKRWNTCIIHKQLTHVYLRKYLTKEIQVAPGDELKFVINNNFLEISQELTYLKVFEYKQNRKKGNRIK